MKKKQICSRCVLPESTPGITFNHNGVCNYCLNYKEKEVKGESELIDLLNYYKSKSKNKKYDCLVGISGGRDSTYVLWKLVRDYKLRVLTVNYDNPFTSDQARINMKNACEILKVETITWGFPDNLHLNSTKKAMKVWAKKPSSKLIPIVCAYCKTWWPGYFSVARANDITLMVIGSNPFETASFKSEGFGGARSYHKIGNLPEILMKTFKELRDNPAYLKLPWKMVARMYLGASHSAPYMKWKYRDINVIRLFDYLKWNEKTVMETIATNLKWKKSEENESFWRFDCRLDFVRRLMYASTVGVTELSDLFSKMIREGMMSRDEAIKRLKKEDSVSRVVALDVLSKLDMNISDLNLDLQTFNIN